LARLYAYSRSATMHCVSSSQIYMNIHQPDNNHSCRRTVEMGTEPNSNRNDPNTSRTWKMQTVQNPRDMGSQIVWKIRRLAKFHIYLVIRRLLMRNKTESEVSLLTDRCRVLDGPFGSNWFGDGIRTEFEPNRTVTYWDTENISGTRAEPNRTDTLQ